MRKQESDLWCADGVWIYLREAGRSVLLVCEVSGGEREGICEVAKKHHVLVVPGSSFACPGYVRLAYCVSYEQIERSLPAFKEIAEEYGLCK